MFLEMRKEEPSVSDKYTVLLSAAKNNKGNLVLDRPPDVFVSKT